MSKIYIKAWGSIDRRNGREEVFEQEDAVTLMRLHGYEAMIDTQWRGYARRAGRYTKMMLAAASECFRHPNMLQPQHPCSRGVFLATATGESEDAVAINRAIALPDQFMISPTHFVSTVSQTSLLAVASRLGTTSNVFGLAAQHSGLTAGLRLAVRAIETGRLDEAWVGVGEICTATPVGHSKRVAFDGSDRFKTYHEGGAWIVLSRNSSDNVARLTYSQSEEVTPPDCTGSYCPADDATNLCEWLDDGKGDFSWTVSGSGMSFRFEKQSH